MQNQILWKSVERFSRFMKVVFMDRQTDNTIFYKVETYLDRLPVAEISIIPNFVKIVRAVLKIYEICVQGQNDRQTVFTKLRPV